MEKEDLVEFFSILHKKHVEEPIKLCKLLKNKNFRNNQNYLNFKSKRKFFLSVKDRYQGEKSVMVNAIGYDDSLNIQEIDYYKIINKTKKFNNTIYLFVIGILILSYYGMIPGGIIFGIIFSSFLIFMFLFFGYFKSSNLEIYRNKDKVIFYKRNTCFYYEKHGKFRV